MSDKAPIDFPQTEEGLQAALTHLAEARASQGIVAEGKVLLKLSHLVKWVRSDNDQPPFERSHALALQALALFRRTDDVDLLIRALIQSVPMSSPDEADRYLQEAEQLAKASGDQLNLARVIAAKSRMMGLRDRDLAKQYALEALAIYRELDNSLGMAGCLFSLSIQMGKSPEKRGYALEAFHRYREVGEKAEAGRVLMVAVMNSDTDAELVALEPSFLTALSDSQESGDRSGEQRCYSHLAKIAAAKGETEIAKKYLRWEAELRDSDGLSPLERWEADIAMTKMLIETGKRQQNDEMVKSFKVELARLKKNKPIGD